MKAPGLVQSKAPGNTPLNMDKKNSSSEMKSVKTEPETGDAGEGNIGGSSCGFKRKHPENYPAFAAILSFLMNYAFLLGCVGDVDLKRVAAWFRSSDEKVPDDFVDFFVNLMKRMQRRATVENWQDLLATLYWRQSEVDSWMLRNSGFNKLPLESRLAMLKYVLERQFDLNEKFRCLIETLAVEDLRLSPVGTDEMGHIYWYFQDSKFNILLYREEPDDCSEDSFLLLANSVEQLTCIVNKLECHDFSLLKIEDEITTNKPELSTDAPVPLSFLEANSSLSENSYVVDKKTMLNIDLNIQAKPTRDDASEGQTVGKFEDAVLNGDVKLEGMNDTDTDADAKVDVKIENISAEPSDSETSMKPKLEINGHCSPLIKSENEQKPTTSGVDVVKYEPTECSTDRPLGKIKKQVALEKVSSDDTDGDLISFVSTDDSQRRSLRLSRSAKSCYRIEETFKLIYRQTQKSPKKKSKSLSHFNSSRDSSIEAGGRSQVSEMQSEDVPLAKLGKKKKRGRKNGERGRKRKAEESDESSERSDDEKIRTEEEEEIYPDEEGYEGCKNCLKKSRPDTILMCDSCDACIHMGCLRPPLMAIPEEEWFCPLCAHNKLLTNLKTILDSLNQQVVTASRKRRYTVQPVPFGFPSVLNVPTYQQPSDPLGFDLPPEFTEGRTLREKRRVNYGYDDYDQEIKAAIRAHNSPFKDATSLCKSDTDDLSSSATYSPSKYGFRSSKRLLTRGSNNQSSYNSSDYTDDDDRSTDISREIIHTMYRDLDPNRSGRNSNHGERSVTSNTEEAADDDNEDVEDEDLDEDEPRKQKYLCSRMNEWDERIRLKISLSQARETTTDGQDDKPHMSKTDEFIASDTITSSNCPDNYAQCFNSDKRRSSGELMAPAGGRLANIPVAASSSTNISSSSTSATVLPLNPNSSTESLDPTTHPRLTMSVMTDFSPSRKPENQDLTNKRSAGLYDTESNSKKQETSVSNYEDNTTPKMEKLHEPFISNYNTRKGFIKDYNPVKMNGRAKRSQIAAYQNQEEEDYDDDESALDYDSSEDFVNDNNYQNEESSEDFESDEFERDLEDAWNPKKKKKRRRSEKSRPAPARISSRLSGKTRKIYSEETAFDEMIYEDR